MLGRSADHKYACNKRGVCMCDERTCTCTYAQPAKSYSGHVATHRVKVRERHRKEMTSEDL